MSEQERQFEKLRREIAVATRAYGDDPAENRRLRVALARADELHMPEDMRRKARDLGTGEVDGPDYEERIYEGYGDAGIAVLVRAITDAPSETQSELEQLFEQFGGNLGDEGCVAWLFERQGVVEVSAEHVDDPDQFLLQVIEWGARELEEPASGADTYRIHCDPQDLDELVDALSEMHPVASASIVYEPTQQVPVEHQVARDFMRFLETLTARVDVRRAYANWTLET